MMQLPLNSLNRMRWRALLVVSACVNVALLAAWLHARNSGSTTAAAAEVQTNSATSGRPHVVVRRQFFSWNELESPDYATYIANLRDINCPEQTIRDIIIADVNAVFAKRRAELMKTNEDQWWRATPDAATLAAAESKLRALESERRTLLTRLLGPDWDQKDSQIAQTGRRNGISLDGPVLGQLPEVTKAAIINVVAESQRRMEELQARAVAEGRKPSSAELAAIRDQSRTELQRLLTPGQLEEFLLRYSQTATDLRAELGTLRYFNISSNEFRALFRARDQFDVKIAALTDSTNPSDVSQRQALEQQREAAIKLALGARRYELYRQLHDSNYRTAYAQSVAAGQPGAVGTVQEINAATQEEMARVRAASNLLTAEQLAIAAKRVELEQLKATAEAYGQPIPPDPNVPQPPEPPQNRMHTMKSGETLGALSTAYGIPVNAILNANPGLQINNLKLGQRIIIPPAPQPAQ